MIFIKDNVEDSRINFKEGPVRRPIGYRVEISGRRGLAYRDKRGKYRGFTERDEIIRDLMSDDYVKVDEVDF